MKKLKNISTQLFNSASNATREVREITTFEAMKLVGFMGLLAIPYVYNSHQSDKKHQQSEKIKEEIKELRAEYITLKPEIVGQNKQSDVAKRLEHLGIEPINTAPINLNTEDD